MRKRNAALALVCVVLGPLVWAWAAGAGPPAAKGKATLRVGTFRRPEILVAFYGSTIWGGKLKDARAELRKAEADGNEKKAKELKAWGRDSQERAHKQLAGEASLACNGLLEHLKKRMPAVAKQAKVHLIVETPLYRDESIELVDVTDLLAKQFTPARKKPKRD